MRVLSLVLLAFVATAILSVAHAATPAPNGVTSITVQFTIRDHVGVYSTTPAGANRTTHRDFERVIATETGVVLKNLGNDRKPVFDTSRVSTTWTNSTLFDQVWRDTPGVNINLVRNFVLTWNTDSALYEYSNLNFFPIDGAGYGNYGSTGHNFHFCLEYHTQFQYRGVESFSFTGDDDVYFFVNNILFVDLGGVHGTQSQSRDLRNTTAAKLAYNMDVNGVYNFDLFYCERHTSASNLVMATNILLNDCPYLDRCGLCTTTAPVSTVNPCLSLNCNNGVCSCPNASCICNAGWIDSPPSGNTTNYCAQKCGDGILQGDEQCDPPTLACCTSTCKFASLGTSCPSSGQACVQNICPGNAARCGVPLPVGSLCSGGSTPPACKQYQCTSADGSTCALVNNNTLTCSDNSACTTDTCVNGACISSTTTTCPSTSCRNAGTCDANTGSCSLGTAKSNGLGCGADPGLSFCVQPTCQSGSCVNTSKPLGTSCGADTPNKCGTSQCDGAGTCRIVPIASATGTTANCTPPPGSCLTSICDTQGSTNCVTVALQDGTSCTNSSLAPNSCQRLGCTAGVCGYLAINEGSSCADGAPLQAFGNDACSRKICQSGSCNVVPNSNLDGNSCNVGSGANPEPYCRVYTCTTGVCQASSVNESKACSGAGSPNNCQQQLCVSGQCSIVPANTGGQCAAPQNNSCALSRCDNAGVCQRVNTPSGVSCNATDLCNLGYCDGNGACAYPSPVVCDPVACFGNLKCDPATGVCGATGCCGDNHIDAGEDCDNTSNPCCVDCHYQAANVPCGLTNECDDKRCVNVSSTPVTICQSNTAVKENNDCTSALPPSNQCQQLKCRSGVCQAVDKADDSSCELGGVGFCAKAACVSGTCDIVANPVRTGTDCSSAYGTVPECNQATCQGTQCVLSSTNDGLACTSLDSRECSDRRCSSGSCQYDFTNYPQSPRSVCTGVSTSNVCLLPGCDGSGNCIFLNTSAGTDCDIPSNPECNLPKCDGAGVCRLVPINIGSACTTSRDLQCQEAKCDVNGNCVVANLTDNTDCSRTDVGQCQDAKCIGGACVLVNTADGSRRCAATSTAAPGEDRSCLDYFCQVADGSCDTPVPKTDNTDCTDLNLCDSDSCTAGVCIHTPSKVCNAPTQPCESPLGTCLSAYGNCTYAGRGQYASCTPRDSELDPRCNASVVGAYRCSTGSPDSPCVPACFAGGVCGDGIVQAGEECDWGDERTGGPCCNLTCMWFADQSPCNNTDATIIATQAAQAANLSASTDLPLYCFNTRCFLSSSTGKSVCSLGYDETVSPSCVPSNDKSSNRTAILASVIPGALLALCLAALGFFFWRRAQKAAEGEWLQEYLNSGNVRVENNAAFVETQNNVNNAAFQPDGNN